ncbi:phospholipid phosphatase-related protein type 3 [Pipistrellus kuhlii]|uniref:Phospholipid phosphatase-related protein type 3 n=1 Tax=Pipistrellus kuhlii TaxID=59472 RepID=A0A7J7XCS5_PIPKU|nr:phospholipid phosphatase-related protein type 3 [Pipistrellus kuhlii]XP_045432776.1 phospholipid phosphatase-related protein type 3 [Pipistrellus kuhlii]KAF6347196.1 phospholipid phosphatase related 3 [Pipistrellus kuhlii]
MLSAKEKNKSPKDSMTLLPCFYFVELPIVASSIVSLYFLELTDLFKPAKVGFQCYDRTLSMPYVETNEELIPLLMLLSLAFAAPAASIMVGEGMLYCLQSRLWGRGGGPGGAEGSINAGGCNFNSFLRRTVRFVGVHVFGLCATALVTDVIQLATGYHAPFFLTVCKPNYTLLGTSCEANPYITQDICSGQDTHAILSARKTFPSQHATLSAFAAVYVSMYFNSVISDTTKLLKPSLVFAFAIAAGVCGLTQITQYRSHPVDVYAGFLIGAGIAAYLACHAVGNFQAPPTEKPTAPTPAKDALRVLTQRGHDSVYQQNKSVSTDELGPPGRLESVPGPVAREKTSLGSLKRASVDVDLLASRSPMGKENMVTFSHTLPRVSTPSLDDPARRHMTIHVPLDASRSKQLISEWKQKSLEGRGLGLPDEAGLGHMLVPAEPMAEEEEEEEEEEEGGEEEGPAPPSLYPTVQARPGLGPRVILPPRPGPQPLVHIPEEGAQAAAGLSPKGSVAVRAKWLMMAEKSGAPVAPASTQPRMANPPRLLQVIAMSKAPGGPGPKAAETALSSSSSSDSSQYRSPSDRDSASIVTIDAHAPHHPVVHLSAGNGPWEWKAAGSGTKGLEGEGTYELGDLAHGFRGGPKPLGVSPGSSVSDVDQEEPRFGAVATVNLATGEGLPPLGTDSTLGPASRESTLRRKAVGLALGERDPASCESEAESYYHKMQAARRFKD